MITQSDYVKHSGLTKGRVSQLVKGGMPLDSVEAADRWRGAAASAVRRARPAPAREVRKAEVALSTPRPADGEKVGDADGDGPAAAYERQRNLEREAYRRAMDGLGTLEGGRLVAIHAQAAKNLADMRAQVLALQEHERQLIPFDWVKRFVLEHDVAIVELAKAMPSVLAARILPNDPQHAERELTQWVEGTFLKTLFETRKAIE